MKTFKALSALLSYPTSELQEAIPQIKAILDEDCLFTKARRDKLDLLMEQIGTLNIFSAQENYVLLFDRSRTLSLNLFEHILGESRERGGAMVDLIEVYQKHGFELSSRELPDHLSVILEFISLISVEEARSLLKDAGSIIAVLSQRLQRRETLYVSIFEALSEFADAQVSDDHAKDLLNEPLDNPQDLTALDAIYAEAQITFGPSPVTGCPVAREQLARMDSGLQSLAQ